MTYERFDRWIKRNKFFSAILIILFITGMFFQASDTFTRIKHMITGEPDSAQAEQNNAYRILNFIDPATFAYTNDAIEFNVQVDMGVETLLIEYAEPEWDGHRVGSQLESSNNEIWLVNLELTDDTPTEINGEIPEQKGLMGLRQDMGFTASFYSPDPSGEGQTLISLHFPKIDPSYQWSDFSHTPLSSSYGTSQNTAFYRLTRFKQKGELGTNFKAEYIVPDADKAQNSMLLLAEMKAK